MFRILLLFSVQLVSAGNILVFNPLLGHSHVRFLGNIADLLADDGHNVTVLTVALDDSIPPFGTSNPKVHKMLIHSKYIDQSIWGTLEMKSASFWDLPEPDGMATDFQAWNIFTEAYLGMYRGLLEDQELLKSLKDAKFDIGVTEIFELGVMGYFEVLGIKSAMVAAALGQISFHFDISGLPYFPSFVPCWATTYSEDMTFVERLVNMKSAYDVYQGENNDVKKQQALFNQFYPDMPSLHDLADAKTGVILSNANEFTESPRPTTNMFQYVGGTNVHPPKPLSEEMNAVLDIRPSSVLFSFGTFIKGCQMPLELKLDILSAFSEFPDHTFLWKYEECENDTTPFADYPNVIPKSWWPQTDLLGDRRVKAFITHAGMNSMLEVSFRGKPTITVPLFADQYTNARSGVSRGMSVMVKRTELSKETITAALKKVLAPDSPVAKKAAMAAAVLKGKDEEYRQSVLRWANLLIEFGPMEHTRLPSKNLSFIQIYAIDCILFVVSVFLAFLVLVFYTLKYLLRFVRKVEKEKDL